jgi:hypothetical protein
MPGDVAIFDYEVISNISNHILKLRNDSKDSAYRAINYESIILYYKTGEYLNNILKLHNYGDGCIAEIAKRISAIDPTIKGFDKRNLYRMRQFYLTYPDFEIVSTLLTQLNWSCNVTIMHRSKSESELNEYNQMIEMGA